MNKRALCLLAVLPVLVITACSKSSSSPFAKNTETPSKTGTYARPETLDRAACSSMSLTHGTVIETHPNLPFSDEANVDGARYVWYMLNRAGADVVYVPAKDLPNSPQYKAVDVPETADVAWWNGWVAIYSQEEKSRGLVSAANSFIDELSNVEKKRGPAKFYRYVERTEAKYLAGAFSASGVWGSFPDRWNLSQDPDSLKVTPYTLEREPVVDAEGFSIVPMLSLVVQDLNPGVSLAQYDDVVVKNFPALNIRETFGVNDGYFSLPDSTLHLCAYTDERKAEHFVYLFVSVQGAHGLYMIIDGTQSIFSRIDPECRFVLKSFKRVP